MAQWGEGYSLCDGPFGAGMLSRAIPFDGPQPARSTDSIFVAAGCVDNRAALLDDLGLAPSDCLCGDAELMRHAWKRWGEAAPSKIFGEWAFAAWDRESRTLFLARDHFGNTALHYHDAGEFFAFASSRRALLALVPGAVDMDELLLAQVLVSWMPQDESRTVHTPVRRLLPAHTLTVTPRRVDLRRYWRLDGSPELLLPRRSDYVEAFLALFDRAVSDRVQGNSVIATALSGGLDSGAVTITAARLMERQGRRLSALTSVPLFESVSYSAGRFGNELPFANATAAAAGNIDFHPFDASGISPVKAVRELLAIAMEPQHAAGNVYWTVELHRKAAALGARTLLTGQLGNGGISWTGEALSQPLSFQLRTMGTMAWMRARMLRLLFRGGARALERRQRQAQVDRSIIQPAFARRIRLVDLWLDDAAEASPKSAYARRCRILQQNLPAVGSLYAETGVATGIVVRDPTADPRLLKFSLSVPDRIFIDPETGLDRWLIREAMKGRLPDEVRLNRKRGRQAIDIVPRLRASADDMEEALSEIARGPAAAYVDVPRMRAAWERVSNEESSRTRILATAVLMRGIMAGLFVNGFGKEW
jgi:asparagine synthase (glutamine-hydrolysing)